MHEELICFAWKYQLLSRPLTSVDGREVQVIDPGLRNPDAGPDFTQSHIRIGQVDWFGDVEVHLRSSDWIQHGHDEDPRYHRLILHVVKDHDRELEEAQKPVATVALHDQLLPHLEEAYHKLVSSTSWVPCAKQLGQVHVFSRSAWLQRMAVERMAAKAQRVLEWVRKTQGHWQQALFILLGRAFGGPVNGPAFEVIAQNIPVNRLDTYRDAHGLRMEAWMLGMAGLLEHQDTHPHVAWLQQEFALIRHKHKVRPLPVYSLKYARMRPGSFPDLRLAQWAHLWNDRPDLLQQLLSTGAMEAWMSLLTPQTMPDYWRRHWRIDQDESKLHQAGPGMDMRRSLIINVLLPVIFAFGQAHGDPNKKEQTMDLLAQLPSESNRLIRRWRETGYHSRHASDSQALYHLYHQYCRPRRCLECAIGRQLLHSS